VGRPDEGKREEQDTKKGGKKTKTLGVGEKKGKQKKKKPRREKRKGEHPMHCLANCPMRGEVKIAQKTKQRTERIRSILRGRGKLIIPTRARIGFEEGGEKTISKRKGRTGNHEGGM